MVKTILIADDNAFVRQALRNMIESESDLAVCGEAENGRDAIPSFCFSSLTVAIVSEWRASTDTSLPIARESSVAECALLADGVWSTVEHEEFFWPFKRGALLARDSDDRTFSGKHSGLERLRSWAWLEATWVRVELRD